MDCPANVELVERDNDGRVLAVNLVACTGSLGDPGIEHVIENDSDSVPVAWGVDRLCDTCGQTTTVETRRS